MAMPGKDCCIWKTLTAAAVVRDGGNPRLFLDDTEAGRLVGCPDDIAVKYPLGTLRENLVVIDVENKKYDMLLSHFKSEEDGRIMYTIDAGWQRFVERHNLKAGDVVYLIRHLGKLFDDGQQVYVARYVKGPRHFSRVRKHISSNGGPKEAR